MLCLKQTQTKQIAPLSGVISGGRKQSITSNKGRNRVASRLDFDVKGAAAIGRRHCRSRQQAQAMAHRKQIAPLSGAICGEMGRKYCFEQRKKSSRFSTRFRCERRGSKWQTALPPAAASGKPHCRSRQQAQAVAHRKQIAPLSGAICGEMGTRLRFEQRKKSSRFSTRFRCE